MKDGPQNEHRWNKAISLLVLVALILCPFGLLASAPAWGEWSGASILTQLRKYKLPVIMPSALSHENSYHAIFDGYTIPGMSHGISLALGYILCAISAIVIFLLIAKIAGAFMKKDIKE